MTFKKALSIIMATHDEEKGLAEITICDIDGEPYCANAPLTKENIEDLDFMDDMEVMQFWICAYNSTGYDSYVICLNCCFDELEDIFYDY